MASDSSWKYVVWERQNKIGKWCPYSPEVSMLLEQNYKKSSEIVPLGDADDSLKIYSVHLKDLVQVSSTTGTKTKIRRRLCDSLDTFCNGFTWQWHDDHDVWHIYDVDVNAFIEKAFHQGVKSVVLNKTFRGYHYEIDFTKMLQINKQTKRKRTIRRKQNSTPYPVTKCTSDSHSIEDVVPTCPPADAHEVVPTCPPADVKEVVNYSDLTKEVPGTTALEQQVNQYIDNVRRTYVENYSDGSGVTNQVDIVGARNDDTELPTTYCPVQDAGSYSASSMKNIQTAALVNGHPWYGGWPPHTHQSKLKPVPGIDPLPKCSKKPQRKKKKLQKKATSTEGDSVAVLEEYTNSIEIDSTTNTEDQVCIICYESLCKGSSYDDDTSVLQLKLCSHMFHKSCLTAMYNSGPKDKCLQCPVCKKIYGEKCGIQPPGNMIYHVLPYSLPGHHECDTIRIIYDISSGTQGPEHPNPGKKYTARGFPRHCYLPDNEMGRKVLRLLIKAWKRRLIFTIGRSSTTCEEDTVTWNEIHHKTEFGCNKRGHGYPDPNYFNNVLSELEAHGIKDDDVYLWYPA